MAKEYQRMRQEAFERAIMTDEPVISKNALATTASTLITQDQTSGVRLKAGSLPRENNRERSGSEPEPLSFNSKHGGPLMKSEKRV